MLRISNVAPLYALFFRLLIFRQFTGNLATRLRIHRGSRPVYCPNKFPTASQAFIAIKLESLIRGTVFSSQASHKNLPHWKRDFSSLSRSEQPGITKSNRKGTTLTTLGNVKRSLFILSWLLTSFPLLALLHRNRREIQVFRKRLYFPRGCSLVVLKSRGSFETNWISRVPQYLYKKYRATKHYSGIKFVFFK